jgi:imidazolonepropionase-like amidohydrolase
VIGREHSDELQAAYVSRLADIRHLHENGVTIALGTDTVAAAGAMSDRFFLAEVNSLASIMSNEDVLAALTRDAAIYLELQDVGTLQPGKRADIVILDGNPLEEIANVTNTRIVIHDGMVVADHRQ